MSEVPRSQPRHGAVQGARARSAPQEGGMTQTYAEFLAAKVSIATARANACMRWQFVNRIEFEYFDG